MYYDNNIMYPRFPLSALALTFRFVFYSAIVNKDDDESTKRTHIRIPRTGCTHTVWHFAEAAAAMAVAHQFGTSGGEDISNL